MKKRKLNFLKLGVLFFGIAVSLWNCEKEVINIEKEEVNLNKIIVEEFSLNNNSNNPIFKSILNKLNSNSGKNKLKKNNSLNLNIDSSKVKKIIFNGKTTYTLFLENETTEEDGFNNLIIEIDSLNKSKAFIIKYLPKNKVTHYKEHNSYDFEGTRVLTEIDFNSNLLLKNSSLKTEVACWFEVWCYYDYPHLAGGSCANTQVEMVCSVSSGGVGSDNGGDTSNSGDTSNGGDSETGGRSGGSGSSNNNNDDDLIITSPILKVCEDGKVYNKDSKKCECIEGLTENASGDCVDNYCNGGKIYNLRSKKCECPKGMVEDSTGNCVKKPCVGDPVSNVEIASPGKSGKKRRHIRLYSKGLERNLWRCKR